MKKPTLYLVILLSWFLLLFIFYPQLLTPIQETTGALHLFVIISTLFVCYFWLNGLKDVIYTLYFYLVKPRLILPPLTVRDFPKVDLVYPTRNDFDPQTLLTSMAQLYPNFAVVICDDSTNPIYMKQIDAFQREYPAVKVVRRADNQGFKAGNLNNYLKTSNASYYVILDSDEVIPADFISSCLNYFYTIPQLGIVQANHVVKKLPNKFVRIFARGVESHWATYQSIKNTYGFLSFLGHGAMISADCFRAVGQFPELVAEDLCFSIHARERGFYTYFAQNIICEEDYPISYLAFKKRHNKWTQGNTEFIKKYTLTILLAKMTWFEKLDIFLFTYNLPLTTIFALYIIINIIVFPLYHFSAQYPVALYAPTIAFLLAPMLNDIIYYRGKMKRRHLLAYCAFVLSLYGSMFFISLQASFLSLFGKSVFLVTPKSVERITRLQAVQANKGELVFAVILIALSVGLSQSIFPVMLLVGPALHSISLTLMSNEQ